MHYLFARLQQKPKLELLSRLPADPADRPPLVFVHGSFISAWCWEEFFLPFFAAHGYPSFAPSLRGHGGSEGRQDLHWHSLSDYVTDLERVVDGLHRPPVLIGHSMGGLIAQKFLPRRPVAALVLLASVPPEGVAGMTWWAALTRPWLLQEISLVQLGLTHFSDERAICRALFSERLPLQQARRYLERTQPESQRALWDMAGYDLPPLHADQRPPTLVLGAENDALVPAFAVRAVAQAFATEAEFVPDMAHIMMLEPDWQRLAERILAWLERQGL